MKVRSLASFVAVLVLVLSVTVACNSQVRDYGQEVQTSGSRSSSLVGTWHYEGGDGGGRQAIDLVLRSDGTYTKTLDAQVGDAHYGGAHKGTWTAEGTTVHLSGNEKWPAYSHDLSTFQKVK